MKVTVFGSGYVGLVQAAVLADAGNHVICVDIDADKVVELTDGKVSIYEPELQGLVQRNVAERRLRFTTDAKAGVAHGAVIFIAVGTPTAENGVPDTRQVLTVATSIGRYLETSRIVAIKSTVPVGTGEAVEGVISSCLAERGLRVDVHVVSNPEFLKEGSAVSDFQRPDRIIVGTGSMSAEGLLRELYAPFLRDHDKMIVMDRRSAELTKYAANAMLATKISFMNEIAAIADVLGADVEHVRRGIGSDPRIGYDFIYPGIGYGGSCFPKDMKALVGIAQRAGVNPHVLSAVEARNAEQKSLLAKRISDYFGGDLGGKTFALWGLAFKPNTDDMREAPANAIMADLWNAGARVRAFDPKAMATCQKLHGSRPDLDLVATREDALEGADALIVATEWKTFKSFDLKAIKDALRYPVIFDGRNVFDPALVRRTGLTYFGIGRA